MPEDKTYQHNKKCPDCGKRKVYLKVNIKEDKCEYECRACGKRWKA